MDNFTTGTIVIGKNTVCHPGRLQDLGYDVEVASSPDDRLRVTVKVRGFVDTVDMSSSGDEAMLDLVSRRMAMTYRTRVRFPDGKVLTGVPACTRLGSRWSCLVMSPPPPPLPKRIELEPPVTNLLREVLKMSNEILALRAEIESLRSSK